MPKLTKRIVESAPVGASATLLWDSELKGFGVRVSPSGARAYIVQYRTEAGRSRRMTIGRHGELTVEEARARARKLLVIVSDGGDPMGARSTLRAAPTVVDLFERHVREHVEVHNSVTTLKSSRDLFERFARPALGALKVASVTRQDVAKIHLAMKGTPRQANLMLAVLSKMFSNAELWGWRSDQTNPCRRVRRYAEVHRERFLSPMELQRLGAALREAETVGLPWRDDGGKKSKHLAKPENRRNRLAPVPLGVVRALLFTGARLSEICELRWEHIDFEQGTIRLPGKKGGDRKRHPVGAAALDLFASIPRRDETPWVFPRESDPSRHIARDVVESAWQRLRRRAGIEDVRLHDLRHTVGTLASQAGANAFVVRDTLRHASTAMTGRYVNFDADPVREISDKVAARIRDELERG